MRDAPCFLKPWPASPTIPPSGCPPWLPDQPPTSSRVGDPAPRGRALSSVTVSGLSLAIVLPACCHQPMIGLIRCRPMAWCTRLVLKGFPERRMCIRLRDVLGPCPLRGPGRPDQVNRKSVASISTRRVFDRITQSPKPSVICTVEPMPRIVRSAKLSPANSIRSIPF